MLSAACLNRYDLSSNNARLRRFPTVYITPRVVTALVLIWIVLPVYLFIIYMIYDPPVVSLYMIMLRHSIVAFFKL